MNVLLELLGFALGCILLISASIFVASAILKLRDKDMIKIKNNTTTYDIRLDRVHEFDERSRNYSIADIRTTKKLRSYTWRCDDHFDQKAEGACVGFSLGHELAARPAEVKDLSDEYLRKQVYWEAQKSDPWDGGAYPGAKPFYEGTSILAGVKQVKRLGYIEEYRWAFNLNDVLYGIGHNGPAVLGINWTEDMYYPDQNHFIKPTGQFVGGHAILARAVNIKEKYITLRNSWGKEWGNNGDCYMTFDDLNVLLKHDGEACFLMERKSKAKPSSQAKNRDPFGTPEV